MARIIPSLHILGGRQYGGADQFYVRLLRALHEAGQPVTAVNRKCSPVGPAIAESGIEQIHLPLANGWDVWSAWKIHKLIAARAPCVVQTYMGRATRLTRLPKHSQAVHIARLGGYYKIDGYYRHADAWIGNTRGICDYLVKSGLPAARVFHIGNFVPEPVPVTAQQLAALRQEWGIPDDAWVLFGLGRLIEVKGFDDLLAALAKMPETIAGRPVMLLIAGGGPKEAALKAQTAELHLERQVRWLGWQDPPSAFYSLADVFVCPSRHEPLGNVILEAWSHGLPVVSTETAGALELIEEGRTGLLTPLERPTVLAARLREMLEASPMQRVAMGQAGRDCLDAHFGKAAILDAYLGLYQDLLPGMYI